MKSKIHLLVLLWILSVAILMSILIVNSINFNTADAVPVDFSITKDINTTSYNQDVFRLAVSSVISPVETVKGYRPLIKYLEDKLGRRIELVQRTTYKEVNDLVETGEIDLAFICTLSYVEAEKNFGAKLVAAPQVQGSAYYRSLVIVREDSNINTIADLQNKKFAFTDPMSFSGRAAMIGELATIGRSPEDMFSSIIYTYSHDNSLRAVADGVVDAACIDSLVFDLTAELYPEITNKIRIIHTSPFVGNPPVILGADTSEEEFNMIRKILLNMHNEEAGRRALETLMYDKFLMPDNDSYNYIRSLIEEVRIDYYVR
jgi:phosphonate transport system substrate-binding protein